MNDSTVLGSTLNQLGRTAKQTAKQTIKAPKDIAENFGEQTKPVKQNSPDAQKANANGKWQSNEEREQFLRDLYGTSSKKSEDKHTTSANPLVKSKDEKNTTSANPLVKAEEKKNTTSADPLVKSQEKLTEFQEKIADKSPEEQKKLMELRDQLHKDTYYDPTFNRPKKQEEERPAEKVENEKKQEMAELQKKEEKKAPPLAVQRERNKAEMFRGAAG